MQISLIVKKIITNRQSQLFLILIYKKSKIGKFLFKLPYYWILENDLNNRKFIKTENDRIGKSNYKNNLIIREIFNLINFLILLSEQLKIGKQIQNYKQKNVKKQNNSENANIKFIKNINRSWINKFYNNLNQYNQNEEKIYFRELKQQFMKIIKQEDEIKFNLIDQSVKQSIKFNAISFNSSGQYMISTEYQNIKVWTFKNGKINYLQTLYGHTKWIQCLLYSKEQNSFISGAGDKTIRCQKNQTSAFWISSKPYKQHTDWVMCLVMNKNEDLLFSGSSDYSIKVWNLDFHQNELTYLYSLNKHNDYVIIIIIINKQSIINYGLKVSFITENSFIWITCDQGIDVIYFFELIEGIYKENQNKSIELMNNNQDYDEYFFPIIYNIQRNLILVRHKSYIYLIRDINNRYFKIVNQLNCYTSNIYGIKTDNGQHLVFWDFKNNGYSIYELQNQ